LEKFTNWFESIWTNSEKDIKEIENRKRKEEKRKKYRKGPWGQKLAQYRKQPAAQQRIPNRYNLFPLSL
jgi:hypothetical protein